MGGRARGGRVAAQRRPLTEEEAGRIDAMASVRERGTLYDVLGLSPTASIAEIEEAYHDLARQWHPDRFYSRDTGERAGVLEENFVVATTAYRILRDAVKRKVYNREAGIDVKQAPPAPASQGAPRSSGAQPRAIQVHEISVPAPAAAVAPPKVPTAVDKIRQQLGEQLSRARAYHDAGRADFDAGRYAKAESALYLAMKFDPQNPAYAPLYEQAATLARAGRGKGFLARAEQEESYGRLKEAIGWYQKAVECNLPDGVAFFRLANLQRTLEQDAHGAAANLRKAVAKEPRNISYRVALGELYESLKLYANAVREAQAALELDPKSDAARALVKKLQR